jgi:thiamine-phosphate pyrophosphorylase
MPEKSCLRVIDVNFNRAKEGLRVCEDILRFIFEDNTLRKEFRKHRHSLDAIAASKIAKDAVKSRNSLNDLGGSTDKLEIKKENVRDLLYANIQRVKESLRVLEEFFKILTSGDVPKVKKMRYQIYELEKKILQKWPPEVSGPAKG